MTLQDIASISGKPGLFKVLKPTRSGVILEALNEKKTKTISGANSRVSILKEISIYTTGAESSVLLESVYKDIFVKHGKSLPVTTKASESELFSFLGDILPNYDVERVYHSDIKKLVSWYNILSEFAPEIFASFESKEEKKEAAPAKAKKSTTTKKASATKEEAPAKKTAAKKPAAKKTTTKKETK